MSAITRYRLLGFALLFSVLGIAHAGHSGKVYDTVFATAAEARDHCPNPGDWVSRYYGKGGPGFVCRYGGATSK